MEKVENHAPISFLVFPNLPFPREISGKRAHLSRCHAKLSLPSRPQTHNEIR